MCKIKIAAFTALSAATGFILFTADITVEIFAPMLGVFVLACGAGALNQYQDRTADAMMHRTESRPIPSGRVEAHHALYIAALLLLAGILILALTRNVMLLGLGIFAVVWYNIVYVYLKKKTAFAAVPGAVIGAIPPAIGWVAGGGNLMDHELLVVCFFFFMWQVPHFWLLLLAYERDYEKTHLPSLSKTFSHHQMIRITLVWMSAAVVSCLLIPLLGTSDSNIEYILLGSVATWFSLSILKVYSQNNKRLLYLTAFKNINIYIIFVMLILDIGSLLK